MAKKPFEIQGANLRIGGVDLQAGTTGVVIPGVTQATDYRVEEVEDTGDQTTTFTPDSEVTVYDGAQFYAILNDLSESGFAVYIATTDGEGYIDDIEVDDPGSYAVDEASRVENNDMYAYIGSGDPTARPIVPEDWDQIPFRPRMRAGDIENIGGGSGSGAVSREINFPTGEEGDTQGTIALTESGDTYICTADWAEATTEIGDTAVTTVGNFAIGQTGGVALIWTVTLADYPELQALIEADGWNGSDISWYYSHPEYFTVVSEDLQSGSAVCTDVGIDNSLDLFFRVAFTSGDSESLPEGSTATIAWEVLPVQPGIWTQINFNSGTLTYVEYTDEETGYPSSLGLTYNFRVDTENSHLDINGNGTWEIGSSAFSTTIFSEDSTGEGGDPVDLVVQANDQNWVFKRNGAITFPDGSVQSTAYTGTAGSRIVGLFAWADFGDVDGQEVTFTSGGIPYQVNNQVDDDPAFGAGSSRIVGVNNNGFLLTATGVNGVTDLYIEGNIGADGGGVKEVIDLTEGTAYNGYYCVVASTHSSGGDPGINRYIIADTPISASFATSSTDYEDLVVTNLDSATDITILNLYSSQEGFITGATVTNDPNPNWTSGGYGVGADGISVNVSIDISGNVTVNSVSSDFPIHNLGSTFTLPGTLFGAASPADDMTFAISSIDASVDPEDLYFMFLNYVDNYTSLSVADRKTLFTNDLDSIFTGTTEGKMLLSSDNISLFERATYLRNLTGSVNGTGLGVYVQIGAAYEDFFILEPGTGFELGEEILIPGGSIGGTTPDNNFVLTVAEITETGGVSNYDINGVDPTDALPYSSLIDGGQDEYDDANYISTNLSRHTFTGTVTVNTGVPYVTLALTSGDLPSFGEVILLDTGVYGTENKAVVVYASDNSGISELVNNDFTLTLDNTGDTTLPGDLILPSGGAVKDIPATAIVGNIATLASDISEATPELVDAGGIDGIPTTFFNANGWIGAGTMDVDTYPTVTFADGTTETITGINEDAFGDSGFITFENNVTKTGSEVWPITITSYNYTASVPAAMAVEINTKQWKFNSTGTLTFPDGTEQTTAYATTAATPMMAVVNADLSYSYTIDGNTWTAPTYFALGSTVQGGPFEEAVNRVALGPNFVVYTGYDTDTDSNNRLFYASRPGEDATLVDIPLLTAAGEFSWLDIQGGGNYVVAVGSYYDVGGDIRWPVWAYTTTGSTWSMGTVDPAYIDFVSGVSAFESVDYDGTGWLFVAAADGAGAGAFYLTNLTGTLTDSNYVNFTANGLGATPDIDSVAWTGSQWVIKYENLSTFAFSDSQDPLTAGWIEVDLRAIAIDNDFYFGGYGWNENPEQIPFYEDAGGGGWYAISGNNGQVLATNNGGDSWVATIPAPYTGTVTGLNAGTRTTISTWEGDFTGGTVWNGGLGDVEKITLSSSVPSDYDGSYYSVLTNIPDGITWENGTNANWSDGAPHVVAVGGLGPTFNIYISGGTVTSVNFQDNGTAFYSLLERITIDGSALGGTSGVDDFVLIVTAVAGPAPVYTLYDTWDLDNGPGTALDSSSFATFEGATFTLKRGSYIDAVGFGFDQVYVGNDDEELYASSDLTTWTKKSDFNNDFNFWNDIAYRAEFGGGAPAQYQLTNNGYAATLDGTGGLSLPGRLILPTAYPVDGAFGSPTALDLNKQVQVLSGAANDGSYSLANGVEGQIMYFTWTTNGVYVLVANARVKNSGSGAVEVRNDYSWAVSSESTNAEPMTMAMAIFVNGAWNLMGGSTD